MNLTSRNIATEHTLDFLCDVTKKNQCLSILEVGCGQGHLAKALMNLGHKVLAIDPSEEAIVSAKSQGVDALATDIFGVSALNFDCVFFTRSLHHIDPLEKTIERAFKLVSPNGCVILEDFSYEKMDESTALWFYGLQNVLDTTRLETSSKLNLSECLKTWQEDHTSDHHVHTGAKLVEGLAGFSENIKTLPAVPYLYRYFVNTLESNPSGYEILSTILTWEKAMVSKGVIQPIGLRVVARP